MKKVGRFYKVSFDQFANAMLDTFGNDFLEELEEIYEDIDLPIRSTSGSAGYDFKSPIGFYLKPGMSITIPTGISADINDGWWLACVPRSGLGFRYRLRLDNTLGVIDSDYSLSDNEGHIFLKITNEGNENLTVEPNDRIMQGIFIPYGITYDDCTQGKRNGGFGSTNDGSC